MLKNGFPKLRQIRTELKMSQKDFAKTLGLSLSTYNNYETGNREPASDFWEAVSKKYDVSVDYLLGLSNERHRNSYASVGSYSFNEQEISHIKKYRSLTDNGRKAVDAVTEVLYAAEKAKEPDNIIRISVRRLPLYTVGASAGTGNPLDDSPYDIVEVGPEAPLQTSFLLKADGDSMEPLIHDGETLYIKQQGYVEDGEIGIFWYDGDVFVKRQEHRC